VSGFALAFLALPFAGFAAQFQAGEEVTLQTGQTVNDDSYIVGGNVVVSSNTQGDLTIAGGNVTILGNVSGDLLVAGGSLNLPGNVGDDLRAVGGNLVISGQIGDDAVIAGGMVHVTSDAVVRGDLAITGGRIIIDAPISGRVEIRADQVDLNSSVSGSVNIAATKIILGERAVIGGDFNYKSPQSAVINPGAVIRGQTNYVASSLRPDFAPFLGKILGFLLILKLAILFIGALILAYVFKGQTKMVVEKATGRFWWSVLHGFIIAVVLPIVSIAVMFTLVGIPFGILGLLTFVIFTILSGLGFSIVFGSWLMKLITKSAQMEIDWKTALLGVVVTSLILLIPVAGGIVVTLFFLATLGGVGNVWKEAIWKNR